MKEFMLEVREYLKTTISLSEKKLAKNKERLKMTEKILKEMFHWVDLEESSEGNYSVAAGCEEKED